MEYEIGNEIGWMGKGIGVADGSGRAHGPGEEGKGTRER